MNYEIEELVPLVGKLTAAYTSFESSSISYEKAEQLMEAVLYCIHEAEYMNQDSTALAGQISARQAYEAGFQCVEQKTKEALKVYHRILPGFCYYENRCLYDTFVKGIPEFFKWYDTRYEPQNTILTLDYPVLKDLSALTGIDRIYEYIICIGLEQCFLGGVPENWVMSVLMQYSPSYRELPENLCSGIGTQRINDDDKARIVIEKMTVVREVRQGKLQAVADPLALYRVHFCQSVPMKEDDLEGTLDVKMGQQGFHVGLIIFRRLDGFDEGCRELFVRRALQEDPDTQILDHLGNLDVPGNGEKRKGIVIREFPDAGWYFADITACIDNQAGGLSADELLHQKVQLPFLLKSKTGGDGQFLAAEALDNRQVLDH